jgi:hypothetical protein
MQAAGMHDERNHTIRMSSTLETMLVPCWNEGAQRVAWEDSVDSSELT